MFVLLGIVVDIFEEVCVVVEKFGGVMVVKV